MAAVNIYDPRVKSSCFLCLRETLQVQQICLTQALFKLTSAQDPRACEILLPLKVESLFPTVL